MLEKIQDVMKANYNLDGLEPVSETKEVVNVLLKLRGLLKTPIFLTMTQPFFNTLFEKGK